MNILGISRDVNFMNIPAEMPLEVIKSKKRRDCDSHIIDISEKLISKKPMRICLQKYLSIIFILLIKVI